MDSIAILKEGMIVTGQVGEIGQTAYITKYFEERKAMGSDNIIRIIPKDSEVSGFLYAYLTSKIGNTFLWKYATGGVQPYINEEMVGSIPVPIFSLKRQTEINSLIVKSSEFRVDGNKSLDNLRSEIEELLEKNLNLNKNDYNKSASVSIKEIKQLEKRFDAPYYSDLGRTIYDKIVTNNFITLSEVSEVFHPILFGKKQLKGTSSKGNALFKSSSMMQLKPETDFWLSLKKVDLYSKLQVKDGWVLVSRTGTVGNIVRISERQKDIYIDDHMIRIIPKENYSGLIYIFLSTSFGQELIKFQKYGSVQDVINSDYISRIPIPLFLTNNIFIKRIQEIVEDAYKMIDKANVYEHEAIQLVEKEIEQWQN